MVFYLIALASVFCFVGRCLGWCAHPSLARSWLWLRRRVDRALLGVSLAPSSSFVANQDPTLATCLQTKGKMTYADAGVSRERADEVVNAIRIMTRDTHTPAVTLAEFGGIFEFEKGKRALIASTDGVGTKYPFSHGAHVLTRRSMQCFGAGHCSQQHLTIFWCTGGAPFFFLDYVAAGRLHALSLSTLVAAMANACKHHGCVILGGETAEMPSVFPNPLDMEIVGFVVGEVPPSGPLDGSTVRAGDVVYGLPSSGPHTNGYSLLAKLYPAGDPALDSFPQLFAPHLSYFHDVYPLLSNETTRSLIHGLVHVTGGGWDENTRRILKTSGRGVVWDEFEFDTLYKDIQKRSGLDRNEMLDTFNCGYGMLVICDPAFVPPSSVLPSSVLPSSVLSPSVQPWARVGVIE